LLNNILNYIICSIADANSYGNSNEDKDDGINSEVNAKAG